MLNYFAKKHANDPDGRYMEIIWWQRSLFQKSAVFDQDIFFCDCLWFSFGLSNISTAKNDKLISFEDGVTLFVKHDELVAIFLTNFFSELADTCFCSLFVQLVLLVHPGSKRCG